METVRIFAWILSKFTRIKTSMWISFKEVICCRKNARKMKARVREKFDNSLDIRKLVQMQLDM